VHYYWANSPEFSEDFEAFGEMTSAFWERYLERKLVALGLDDDRAAELSSQLQPRMEERYQPVPWVPPDVHPTLVALRQEGYGLGLVSNRSMPIDDELDDLELAQYFNFQLTAGEINSWKPDQEIFEHALDLAQSTPRETSYIGDNYFTDVLGAQKMGLHTILVDPHGTFPDAECTVISSIGELMDDI
jgi:HAD superfamily hydrolase (TIGR01549 family)